MSARLLGLSMYATMPSQSAKLVLLALVDCCDEQGRNIFPSNETISIAAQCSVRTVIRVLDLFCEVGLLRLVAKGGRGRGSTNHYNMNLDVLRLIEAKGWAAAVGPIGASSHADNADIEPDEVCRDAGIKDDMVTPLTTDTVTSATNKGDTGVTQPLNRIPQEFERERGRADAGLGAGAATGSHAGSAAPGSADLAGLPEFLKRWPTSAADDQARVTAEWGRLTMAERRAALDGIEPFLENLKRLKRSHPPAGWKYLGEKRWGLLPEMRRDVAQGEMATVSPFSKRWWALFHRARAEGRGPKFMLHYAGSGKPWAAKQGDIDAARPEALKGFPAEGETAARFLAEAGREGFHFPAFRAGTWIFLPDRAVHAAEVGAVGEAGFS